MRRRPARGDLVATVGETLGEAPMRALRDRMLAHPEGRQVLADRPRITVGSTCHHCIFVLDARSVWPRCTSCTAAAEWPCAQADIAWPAHLKFLTNLHPFPQNSCRMSLWATAGTCQATHLGGPTPGSWGTGASWLTTGRLSGAGLVLPRDSHVCDLARNCSVAHRLKGGGWGRASARGASLGEAGQCRC